MVSPIVAAVSVSGGLLVLFLTILAGYCIMATRTQKNQEADLEASIAAEERKPVSVKKRTSKVGSPSSDADMIPPYIVDETRYSMASKDFRTRSVDIPGDAQVYDPLSFQRETFGQGVQLDGDTGRQDGTYDESSAEEMQDAYHGQEQYDREQYHQVQYGKGQNIQGHYKGEQYNQELYEQSQPQDEHLGQGELEYGQAEEQQGQAVYASDYGGAPHTQATGLWRGARGRKQSHDTEFLDGVSMFEQAAETQAEGVESFYNPSENQRSFVGPSRQNTMPRNGVALHPAALSTSSFYAD